MAGSLLLMAHIDKVNPCWVHFEMRRHWGKATEAQLERGLYEVLWATQLAER